MTDKETVTVGAITTAFVGASPRIAIDVLGCGPLVVFLHGIGGNRRNWTAQIAAVAAEHRAVAWDMRGYGDSDDYTGALRLDDICADLARVLDHFHCVAAHLVGLSMGGMIAQEFYRRYPDRVRSLVLCNTNAGIGVDFSPGQKEEFVELRRRPLLEGKTPVDLIPAMRGVLFGSAPPPSAIAAIEDSLATLHTESYIKAIEAIIEFDSADILGKIRVPSLLIGATDDKVTPLDTMRDMAERIPCAKLVVLDGAGHLSNLEQPKVFNHLLVDFLTQAAAS